MTFLYEIVNWMNRKMVWTDSWAREIPLFCQLTWCQWVGWRRRRRGPGRQLILLGDARRWLVKINDFGTNRKTQNKLQPIFFTQICTSNAMQWNAATGADKKCLESALFSFNFFPWPKSSSFVLCCCCCEEDRTSTTTTAAAAAAALTVL